MRRRWFITAALLDTFGGGLAYRAWLGLLTVGAAAGGAAYAVQLRDGLRVTNMTDAVSWGIYIANFNFGVGIAAAAVMVVIPAYAYRVTSFRRIVFVGESLALAAVVMCLLFVTVDLGRPDRAWHLIPFLGALNFPASVLSWDVVVLGGYLAINAVLVSIALRAKYYGRRPSPRVYVPLIFVGMLWAISIHTVTAFLYTWLGARPFWNSAIVVPRFLASAFVSGPAFLVIALRVLRSRAAFPVADHVFLTFRRIIAVTLLTNIFLFAAEIFTELYGGSLHAASLRYLLFGHHDHDAIRAYVWGAVALEVAAALVLLTPLRDRPRLFDAACVASFLGVWVEKGMGLVVPGFIPTPLGEVVEYVPSFEELSVSTGIFSVGLLLFTVLVRLGVRIETGALGPATPNPARDPDPATPLPDPAPGGPR